MPVNTVAHLEMLTALPPLLLLDLGFGIPVWASSLANRAVYSISVPTRADVMCTLQSAQVCE